MIKRNKTLTAVYTLSIVAVAYLADGWIDDARLWHECGAGRAQIAIEATTGPPDLDECIEIYMATH